MNVLTDNGLTYTNRGTAALVSTDSVVRQTPQHSEVSDDSFLQYSLSVHTRLMVRLGDGSQLPHQSDADDAYDPPYEPP